MAPIVTTAADWIPPQSIIDAASRASVRYTNPPLARDVDQQYRGLTRTQLPIAPGTQLIRDHVVAQFGVRQTYMPGRSRVHLDDSRLDTHEAGVAIDFMVPGDKAKGDAIANYLLQNAEAMGVQYIVWSGNRWSAGQAAERRMAAYEGSVKHRDHPHVELSTAGARMDAPWFRGRARPSEAAGAALSRQAGAPFADKGSALDEHGPALLGSIIGGGALVIVGGIVLARSLRR